METVHISVRELVAFTCHEEDIRPSGSLAERMEGQLGHKARQRLLPEEWRSEVGLFYVYNVDDELSLSVSGRMDAYFKDQIPIIEEIKVNKRHIDEPYTAHLYQAVCYGFMLCEQESLSKVLIRIAYVTKSGEENKIFDQYWTQEECKKVFFDLLIPYLHRTQLIRKHCRERNASVSHLDFPYPVWRKGQHEMAEQVFTAIKRKRRLYASLPTGCGKSAATLFPAIKALALGFTARLYYLTSRTTQRQGPLDMLERLRLQPLHLWILVLDSKEKQCPEHTVCHPDWCPRAKGHFIRADEALEEILHYDLWTPELIRSIADKHHICPFEFSLSLAELADLTICDYNYAFHPSIHIQRIFDKTNEVTLLVDEAHHLNDRVRDMLTGRIDLGRFRRLRTVVGKYGGRKHPLYISLTNVIREMENLLPDTDENIEDILHSLPEKLDHLNESLMTDLLDSLPERFPWDEVGEKTMDIISDTCGFVRARRQDPDQFTLIRQAKGKSLRITVFPVYIDSYLREVTEKKSGTIYFSATLDPLQDMMKMLGSEEEDACFAMPSPFDPSNLLILRENINTRYRFRNSSYELIASRICMLQTIKKGHYIVFFPSFSYMQDVYAHLADAPYIHMQTRSMTDSERASFMAAFKNSDDPITGLCVMGGLFSEGIDLPGKALDGVIIVGVGLPQVNIFLETLRQKMDEDRGNGFKSVYQIPGMQKVAQAVGRVIRTENDRGFAILLDDRFSQSDYLALCPPHWQIRTGNTVSLLKEFWSI